MYIYIKYMKNQVRYVRVLVTQRY